MAMEQQSENFEKLNLILESEALNSQNIQAYINFNKGKYIYHLTKSSLDENFGLENQNENEDETKSRLQQIEEQISDLNL